MKDNPVRKLVFSAVCLALAYVLPFLTGQLQEIGSMLCPMHIPVLLCGFVCGGPWGLAVGFLAPLTRSLFLGMPKLFPQAFSMAFELGTYGLSAGLLYRALPRRKSCIYGTLILAMVAGRLVWGAVQFLCMGLDATRFGLSAFWAGAVANALPGIILQIILIPVLIMALEKTKLISVKV